MDVFGRRAVARIVLPIGLVVLALSGKPLFA
jgi:hypothetical protein